MGVTLFRLSMFLLLRIFGIEFWIFPNLFADVSVIDSFIPPVSWEKANDGKIALLVRILGVVLVALLLHKLSQEPNLITGNSLLYFKKVNHKLRL